MPESVIGQPQTRVDGRLKVTGKATYAAENNPQGLLYAVLVYATISKGTIDSIDSGRAREHHPSVQVITDFVGVHLPFDITKVNFFGQPVAVVLADTLERAAHAAALVNVHYSPDAAITDIGKGQPKPASNRPDHRRGDPERDLDNAHVVVDRTYTVSREHHNPMEPPATVAQWSGDQLTVWDKTQWVQGTRDSIAKALGIPAENARVLSPFVGGAFGSVGYTWPHQLLAAYVAKKIGAPVKLVLTRKQMYSATGYRPASRQRLRIGADAEGKIIAISHEAHTETARYADFADFIGEPAKIVYASPSVSSQHRIVPLDTSLPTAMRGPGWASGSFALESAVDELAHQLNLDPIELRRRNEATYDQTSGLPFSTRRLIDCYALGAQRFGWHKRDPRPRMQLEGDLLIGMGMASAVYHTFRFRATSLARINDDGTAVVATATSDMGPGTYTSMTQVAADALGLPMSRVTFQLGDSALPQAPMHSGSITMASVGSAVLTACRMLRDGFVRMAVVDPASPLNSANPADVSVSDGRLFLTADPNRGETYQQILKRKRRASMDSTQSWDPGDVAKHYSSQAYGAVFAEVSVDELLGLARIRRIFAVYDVGRVVNPLLAHSQAIGAMVMGAGMALLEETHTDHRDGRLVNANLSDYLVPVNADIPELDAAFLEGEDMVVDPLGVKGLGEAVMVGVPGAIANAVFNATGKRVTDLPITLEKLL